MPYPGTTRSPWPAAIATASRGGLQRSLALPRLALIGGSFTLRYWLVPVLAESVAAAGLENRWYLGLRYLRVLGIERSQLQWASSSHLFNSRAIATQRAY